MRQCSIADITFNWSRLTWPRLASRQAGLAGPNGSTVVESRITLDAVGAAMALLPEEQRVLIGLVCIDGYSYKEAADITGTPIGTIICRLARARRELHAHLEGDAREKVVRLQASKPGSGA